MEMKQQTLTKVVYVLDGDGIPPHPDFNVGDTVTRDQGRKREVRFIYFDGSAWRFRDSTGLSWFVMEYRRVCESEGGA